jgi:hypothetical protein
MAGGGPVQRVASLLLLRETRALLRSTPGRLLFASVVLGYLLLSMTVGQMLVLGPTGQGSTTVAILPSGYPSWNYPELLVVAPNAVLALPYLSTVVMVVVSLGVGLGMSASAVIALRIIRRPRPGGRVAGALGAVEGLSPALIAALTLGACCSTTAASTAGLGLAAQASGTSVATLLANTWFLNLLQVLVLGIALLAQEQLIEVYGRILGVTLQDGRPVEAPPQLRAVDFARGFARLYLVAAGALSVLAMFLAWTAVAPASASAGLWFQWIVVYEAVGVAALLGGLFPGALVGQGTGTALRGTTVVLRAVLGLGAVLLLFGVPPPLTGWGLHGFVNELLGAAGAPASWGAVHPALPLGLALYLRWAFEYVGLAGFALALAAAPGVVTRWLTARPGRRAETGAEPASESPGVVPARTG